MPVFSWSSRHTHARTHTHGTHTHMAHTHARTHARTDRQTHRHTHTLARTHTNAHARPCTDTCPTPTRFKLARLAYWFSLRKKDTVCTSYLFELADTFWPLLVVLYLQALTETLLIFQILRGVLDSKQSNNVSRKHTDWFTWLQLAGVNAPSSCWYQPTGPVSLWNSPLLWDSYRTAIPTATLPAA